MPVLAPGSVSMRIYPHNDLPAAEIVEQMRVQAALAADSGFDGVMTSEHHGGFAGYLPNPLQMAGWMLEAMPSGWAAPCPLLLPLRPVAMVAEEVAWLAARFPGRVGVGVAPGALELDFEVMGLTRADAMPRFREGLPTLAGMLRGEDLGQLADDPALRACVRTPVPVVSAAMSPAAVRRAATCGVGVLFDGATEARRQRELVEAYAEAGGRGPRVLIRRVWLGDPPRDAFERQHEIYQSYTPEAAQEHWRDNGFRCFDDPELLAARLADDLDSIGADALNLRVHAPGVDPERARDQIAALGARVLPTLRARFSYPDWTGR